MTFSYKKGTYIEGAKVFEGEIVLSKYKLYLRTSEGEITQSFIPVDKIERLKISGYCLMIDIRSTMVFHYSATIKGEKDQIKELTKDLVSARGLKKIMFKNEWVEVDE